MNLPEALLRTDFQQCSSLLEHYDERFGQGIRFAFSVFAGAVLSVIILQHTAEDLFLKFATISGIYLTAWVGGTVLLTSLARNRMYFCRAASYVSEIRQYYLNHPSIEVENRSEMFTDVGDPDPLTPNSSRTILMFGIAIVNSLFLGMGTFYAFQFIHSPIGPVWITIIVVFLSSLAQIATLQRSLS